MGKTWVKRSNTAKKKHRPKLKDWSCGKFAMERKVDYLKLRNLPSSVRNISALYLANTLSPENLRVIDRISCNKLAVQEFVEIYEKPAIPCIITDIPTEDNWPALQNWTFEALYKRFKHRLFKVGEDDDGYKVKLKMKYFLEYLSGNSDDSPLYIFDGSFDNDATSKSLLADYCVPKYFRDDFFSLVGEKRRPPYRWFLVGPERSGTTVHIDPLGTSAWNTVICGRKRWVLFPPSVPKRIVKGLEFIQKGQDDEPVNYFVDILPQIVAKYGSEYNIIEFNQEAYDTVFVPGGWWHAVINLEDSIAITQNLCSRVNFNRVWRATRVGRKKMAVKWLNNLITYGKNEVEFPPNSIRPVLATNAAIAAIKINRSDDFTLVKSSEAIDKLVDECFRDLS